MIVNSVLFRFCVFHFCEKWKRHELPGDRDRLNRTRITRFMYGRVQYVYDIKRIYVLSFPCASWWTASRHAGNVENRILLTSSLITRRKQRVGPSDYLRLREQLRFGILQDFAYFILLHLRHGFPTCRFGRVKKCDFYHTLHCICWTFFILNSFLTYFMNFKSTFHFY